MARKVLIGSTNPSKVEWLKGYLSEIPDIECVTLRDLGVTIEVPEEGRTPEENAGIKALAYQKATGLAAIAEDSGLYFQEFPVHDPRQPGLCIRRVNGETLDDDGMLRYYSSLAAKYGPLHACYCAGFAAADENGTVATFSQDRMDDEKYVSTFGFLMCAEPHKMRRAGWPLDSISKDLKTGEYWYDQDDGLEDIQESEFSRNYRYNVNKFFTAFFKDRQN